VSYPKEFSRDVAQQLLAPFHPSQVDSKPAGKIRVSFIDARTAHQRLDEVVGPGGWSFTWEPVKVADNHVVVKGRLEVLGVVREDAGEHYQNERREDEECVKAAVSDSFKRCCVAFGVGRQLYELGPVADRPTEAQLREAAIKAGWEAPAAVITCCRRSCGVVITAEQAERTLRQWKLRLCDHHEQQLVDHFAAENQKAQEQAQRDQDGASPAVGDNSATLTPKEEISPVVERPCAACGAEVSNGQATVSRKKFQRDLCPKCFLAEDRRLRDRIAASPAV
jgi:hypothetical protein